MDQLTAAGVLAAAGAVVAALFGLMLLARQLLFICPPNMVLIFSGRTHQGAGGQKRGYRVIFGGRAWRVPVLESVQSMSLNVMEIPIAVRNAYSRGGIPLSIDAIANVKLTGNPGLIGNAIERFLGRTSEIPRVAKETLEGHLRGVLSTLTPEEVNEDRLKFASSLAKESVEDFQKLGLQLDTLKIQNVSDEVQYLNSIGRNAIAKVVRDAEMAESDAQREAAQVESEAAGRASVIEANVAAAVAKMENELRRVKAELESRVRSEEERTVAAAAQARAQAEQELQRIRVELEAIRLEADRVLPADADRRRRELEAEGEAAAIRERGRAVAEALELLRSAWSEAGDAAPSILVIEDLEKHLRTAALGVAKVRVDRLRMLDGGDGRVLSGYLAAWPAMIRSVFRAVADTTGIDIPRLVAGEGKAPPAAAADAAGEAER